MVIHDGRFNTILKVVGLCVNFWRPLDKVRGFDVFSALSPKLFISHQILPFQGRLMKIWIGSPSCNLQPILLVRACACVIVVFQTR